MERSIFKQYYEHHDLVDRYQQDDKSSAVDVIIPIIHTNELWEANLFSIYKEIPVKRLLLGDGGCIDNSIAIAKKFPRVEIHNHKSYKSLGYSLRKLIEAVDTGWFIYLHSDVYLPENWFDIMQKHQSEYDWFGCPMRMTTMVEYHNVNKVFDEVRPYAGSQMGRKQAFVEGIKKIDDDFVYRQEDFVLAGIVEDSGFKEGRIEDTFHYHQIVQKESAWSRKIKKVSVEVDISRDEEVRASTMQIKGIVKYLKPTATQRRWLSAHIGILTNLGEFNREEFTHWVAETNPVWLPSLDTIFSKELEPSLFQLIFRGMKKVIKHIVRKKAA